MVAQIAKTERKHAMAPTTAAQEKRLRVLIPYDGSETAEATLKDLSKAALPPELDALILHRHTRSRGRSVRGD
jgi:hypothetical protein